MKVKMKSVHGTSSMTTLDSLDTDDRNMTFIEDDSTYHSDDSNKSLEKDSNGMVCNIKGDFRNVLNNYWCTCSG